MLKDELNNFHIQDKITARNKTAPQRQFSEIHFRQSILLNVNSHNLAATHIFIFSTWKRLLEEKNTKNQPRLDEPYKESH